MDTYLGKSFITSAVNPGHILKWWRFIDFKNVDFTGGNTQHADITQSVCVC